MKQTTITDEIMVRYLLGEISQAERVWLEEQYFTDDDCFEQLLVVQDDLIDAYVRGELSAERRDRFETHYLISPKRRQRVGFARTLLAAQAKNRVRVRGKTMAWWQLGRKYLMPRSLAWRLAWAAAALIVILGMGAWLVSNNVVAPRFTSSAIQPVSFSSEFGTATYTLSPRRLEEVLPSPKLLLPAETRTMRLQFTLDQRDNYQSYRIDFHNKQGEEIWSMNRIATSNLATGKALVVDLPALELSQTEYVVTLNGLYASEVVVVVDYEKRAIIQIDPLTGARTILSSHGKLVTPSHLAIDADGNIFVTNQLGTGETCQLGCGNVIRIDPMTGAQIELASGGRLGHLQSIAIDSSGNLLVVGSDQHIGAVIRIDPATGAQTIVSSGGEIVNPMDIAVNAQGEIFVADDRWAQGQNGSVIRIDSQTGAQTLVSSKGLMQAPRGIVVAANGDVFVADMHEHVPNFVPGGDSGGPGKIIRVNPLTGEQTVVSSGQYLVDPHDIAIDSSGDLLIVDPNAFAGGCDIGCGGIIGVNPTTGEQRIVASEGGFVGPLSIAVVPAKKNAAFVVANEIRRYDFQVVIE